jgi:hypothetical protein
MNESRLFKVGNELTDLPRPIWYYDTMNVAVKRGFAIPGKWLHSIRIKAEDPRDFTGMQQKSLPSPVTR